MSVAHTLLAFLVVVIWGFNFVVIKVGLASLPPLLFSALRFLFAALPLVFFVRRPKIPFAQIAAYGWIQFTLQFALLFEGMKMGMPAGLSSLVIQLQVFFTIGLAILLLRERPRPLQVTGGLVGLLGMLLVGLHIESTTTLVGFAMVVASGAAWACANILAKRMRPVDALALVAWASLLAAPPLLVLSYLIEGPAAITTALSNLDAKSWFAIFFQAYPNTILGYGIWAFLVRRYPAASVAPFSLLVPVTGMLSGSAVLGEPMQWWKLVAGALVLCGLALNQWSARGGIRRDAPPMAPR